MLFNWIFWMIYYHDNYKYIEQKYSLQFIKSFLSFVNQLNIKMNGTKFQQNIPVAVCNDGITM